MDLEIAKHVDTSRISEGFTRDFMSSTWLPFEVSRGEYSDAESTEYIAFGRYRLHVVVLKMHTII